MYGMWTQVGELMDLGYMLEFIAIVTGFLCGRWMHYGDCDGAEYRGMLGVSKSACMDYRATIKGMLFKIKATKNHDDMESLQAMADKLLETLRKNNGR